MVTVPRTAGAIPPRDLTIYDEGKKAYAVDPGRFEAQVGASSVDVRARAAFTVNPAVAPN